MTLTILMCVHSINKSYDNMIIRALESLNRQTYKKFDVVIVLDECWEHTKGEIENKNFFFDYKIIEKEKKQGLAIAKNVGLKQINSDYVGFIDGDDMYVEDKLEKQVKYLKYNDVDFLGTLCWNLVGGVKRESCFKYGQYETHEDIKKRLPTENVITHGSMIIKRKCLEELDYYNNVKGAEDWDLWKRAIKKYKFYQLQERLYILSIGTSVPR